MNINMHFSSRTYRDVRASTITFSFDQDFTSKFTQEEQNKLQDDLCKVLEDHNVSVFRPLKINKTGDK